MNRFWDFIGFMGFILPVALLFGLALAAIDFYVSYQCGNFQQITGKETRYAQMDACYIKTADGWQRWDEYKARAMASEGLSEATP